MGDIRRPDNGRRVYHKRRSDVPHHHRNTVRTASHAARALRPVALRRRGRIHSRSDRVPLNAAQRNMDIHRRNMDCPIASGPRRILLHNHHRHTVRSAALQTDELCISTLRPHRSAPIALQIKPTQKEDTSCRDILFCHSKSLLIYFLINSDCSRMENYLIYIYSLLPTKAIYFNGNIFLS